MATLEERKAKRREQKKLYKREERARENAEKAKTHARILHLRANYSKKRPRADDDDAEDAQPAAAPRAPAVRPVVPPARPLTATPSRRRRTPSRDEVVDGRPSLPPQPALTAPVECTEARPPSPEPTAVHAVPPEPGPNDTVRLQYTRSACMEAGDDPVQAGTYMGIVVETKGAKAKVYWHEVDGEPYPGDLDNPSWGLIEGLEVVSVGDHSSRFRKPTAFLHETAAVVSDNESDDDDDDNTRGRRANSSKITAAAKAAGLVVVTLEHHGNNSHRRRTLGPGGFKPDAGDAKARTLGDSTKNMTVAGQKITGSCTSKRPKRVRGVDETPPTVYSGGRPYIKLEDGTIISMSGNLELALTLMSFPLEYNLAALTDPDILKLLAGRVKDKQPIRLIDRALPQKSAERLLKAALRQHDAENKPVLSINLFAGGLNGGDAAARAVASEVPGSLSIEADETCCAVMKKIDELRRASGQRVEHTVLCKVLGKKGDKHEMDRGDGSKKVSAGLAHNRSSANPRKASTRPRIEQRY